VISNKPGTRLSFDGGKLTTDAATATIRMNKKGKIISAFETTAGSTIFNGKPISEGN